MKETLLLNLNHMFSALLQGFLTLFQMPLPPFLTGRPGNGASGYPCGHPCLASHPVFYFPPLLPFPWPLKAPNLLSS